MWRTFCIGVLTGLITIPISLGIIVFFSGGGGWLGSGPNIFEILRLLVTALLFGLVVGGIAGGLLAVPGWTLPGWLIGLVAGSVILGSPWAVSYMLGYASHSSTKAMLKFTMSGILIGAVLGSPLGLIADWLLFRKH